MVVRSGQPSCAPPPPAPLAAAGPQGRPQARVGLPRPGASGWPGSVRPQSHSATVTAVTVTRAAAASPRPSAGELGLGPLGSRSRTSRRWRRRLIRPPATAAPPRVPARDQGRSGHERQSNVFWMGATRLENAFSGTRGGLRAASSRGQNPRLGLRACRCDCGGGTRNHRLATSESWPAQGAPPAETVRRRALAEAGQRPASAHRLCGAETVRAPSLSGGRLPRQDSARPLSRTAGGRCSVSP